MCVFIPFFFPLRLFLDSIGFLSVVYKAERIFLLSSLRKITKENKKQTAKTNRFFLSHLRNSSLSHRTHTLFGLSFEEEERKKKKPLSFIWALFRIFIFMYVECRSSASSAPPLYYKVPDLSAGLSNLHRPK